MTIEIDLDGSRHLVALRRDGERWVAAVDGREFALWIAEAGGRWSMLAGPAAFAPHTRADLDAGQDAASTFASYDVAIEGADGGGLVVHVNGLAVPLTVVDPRHRWRRGRSPGGRAAGPLNVLAPMPGRIVKVLVSPGDTVQPRQGLVVIEAMKMENELRAPRAGTVGEVRATEGALVEANATLMVLV